MTTIVERNINTAASVFSWFPHSFRFHQGITIQTPTAQTINILNNDEK